MMSQFEKEMAYEDLYRQGRQAKDIYKYIPDKFIKGVTNAFSDSDGYWVELDHEVGGWVAYDEDGTIHEYTIADLKAAIKTIRCTKKLPFDEWLEHIYGVSKSEWDSKCSNDEKEEDIADYNKYYKDFRKEN